MAQKLIQTQAQKLQQLQKLTNRHLTGNKNGVLNNGFDRFAVGHDVLIKVPDMYDTDDAVNGLIIYRQS